jgi:hypothetical protein
MCQGLVAGLVFKIQGMSSLKSTTELLAIWGFVLGISGVSASIFWTPQLVNSCSQFGARR